MKKQNSNFRILDDGAKISNKTSPLQNFIQNMPQIIENTAVWARCTKIRYDALIKAGFTPDEALILCK